MSRLNPEKRYQRIEKLFKNLASTFNPSGEEYELMVLIKNFLREHHLIMNENDFILFDRQVGMIFKCCFGIGDENAEQRGICLFAHLDSDHIPSRKEDLKQLVWKREHDLLYYNEEKSNTTPEVGLDDKTGICVILETLLRLKEMNCNRNVYVCFSVQEETGQKGVMRMDNAMFKSIIEDGIVCGIAIDRMTYYHPENIRHLVDEYCGIKLVPNNQRDVLMNQFNKSSQLIEQCDIDFIPSENCSDVLEYKIKLDCEIIAPEMLKTLNALDEELFNSLESALEKYNALTEEIKSIMNNISATSRVSGFKSHPRFTRYILAQKINSLIYSKATLKHYMATPLEKYLNVSFVNMSLDYDDSCGFVSLKEIDSTAEILFDFIHNQQA